MGQSTCCGAFLGLSVQLWATLLLQAAPLQTAHSARLWMAATSAPGKIWWCLMRPWKTESMIFRSTTSPIRSGWLKLWGCSLRLQVTKHKHQWLAYWQTSSHQHQGIGHSHWCTITSTPAPTTCSTHQYAHTCTHTNYHTSHMPYTDVCTQTCIQKCTHTHKHKSCKQNFIQICIHISIHVLNCSSNLHLHLNLWFEFIFTSTKHWVAIMVGFMHELMLYLVEVSGT